MATFVKELLDAKGGAVWTIEPGASVYDAIARMSDKQIGALLAVEGDKVVGIITERDYARKVVLQDRSSRTTRVSEVMTERVVYIHPDQSIEECMALMTEKRVRHLPVLEGKNLVGMISIGDVVKEIIKEKEFLIDQLTRYISGV